MQAPGGFKAAGTGTSPTSGEFVTLVVSATICPGMNEHAAKLVMWLESAW